MDLAELAATLTGMDASGQVTGEELLAAHPVFAADPVLGADPGTLALADRLAACGWTPQALAATVAEWGDLDALTWLNDRIGLLRFLTDLGRAGLTVTESRAWLRALLHPYDDHGSALAMPTGLYGQFAEAHSELLDPARVRAYRDATGGDGLLALLAARAGLGVAETRERAAAGTLDPAGLELLAGLRGRAPLTD